MAKDLSRSLTFPKSTVCQRCQRPMIRFPNFTATILKLLTWRAYMSIQARSQIHGDTCAVDPTGLQTSYALNT
jgi:hypothetical protein